MRKNYLILILAIACSSCNKILDYYNHSGNNKPSNCKITSIKYYGPLDGILYRTLDFEYYDDGRPKGVMESFPAEDPEGYYGYEWPYYYDEKGRMVRSGPLSTPYPTATLYVYEGDSRLPIRDTIIRMDGPAIEDFTYDAHGRIIQVDWRHWAYTEDGGMAMSDTVTYRYYYDLRGNRQEHPSNIGYKGLIKYSDKPSLYSLSQEFRIQYQDWSKNSTLIAESYNEEGLPLKLAEDQPHPQPLIDLHGGDVITYDCD
jgi:hypothetical protein